MGNLLGWIRGLWEDRGERREPLEPLEPLEPSEPSSTRDISVSSDISYDYENVQASSDISSNTPNTPALREIREIRADMAQMMAEMVEMYESAEMAEMYKWKAKMAEMKAKMADVYESAEMKAKMYGSADVAEMKAKMADVYESADVAEMNKWTQMADVYDSAEVKAELAQMKAEMTQMAVVYESVEMYKSAEMGTKSPIEETARSLTDDQAEREILDIIQEIKQEIPGIQATRACRNLETRRFEITVISKRSNEARRRAKDIITKRNSRDLDYDLEVREITEEGITVTNSGEFTEFFAEKGYSKEIFKLQRVISKHSDSFMKNEPNITCISFSPVKSIGYGTAEHKIVKESCIVFFVQVKFDKKRIPLGSQRIPEIIDDIKTDVREGIVESFMQPPWDALNIALGCPISAHKIGTLGPVVSKGQNRTGFLTSLHVLLSSSELTAVSKTMPNYVETGHGTPVHKVPKDENNEIGKVIGVYFANGDTEQLNSGYEVGLVELHSGVRIEKGNSQTNGLARFMGETTAATENNCENTFKKLGAVTGLTEGDFAGFCPARLEYDKDNIVVLYCQIGLYTKKDSRRDFAEPGDSGAIVTIEEENGDKIIGIFTGKCKGGPYIVTPIQPICDRLQIDGWTIGKQRNHNDNGVPMDIS